MGAGLGAGGDRRPGVPELPSRPVSGEENRFRYRENLIKTGALAAAVLVLMFASVLIQSFLQQRRLSNWTADCRCVPRDVSGGSKDHRPYQQMQIRLQEIKKSAGAAG